MGMTRASLQGTQSTRPDQSPKKGQPVGLRSFRNDRCSRPLPTWLQGLERGFRLRRGGGALVRRATTNSHEFGGPPNSHSAAEFDRTLGELPPLSPLHSAVPPAAGQLSLLTSHSQCLATPTARMARPSIPTMRTSTSTARTTSGSAARSRCSGAVTVGVCRRAKFAKLILRVRAKFKSCEFADFAVFANSPRIREAKLPDPARITALVSQRGHVSTKALRRATSARATSRSLRSPI